jgi:hypothetical protein
VKYKSENVSSPFEDVDSTDKEKDSSDDGDDADDDVDAIQLTWKAQTTIQEGDNLEDMIVKAHEHVEKAQIMQQMLSGKANLALDWYKSTIDLQQITDELWNDAVDTVVGDYCQNLALPYLGEHQPGETYYFSPLTVNCFGLANVGLPKALLLAFIYHEGEGKKGGNNVASLIWRYLDENAYINRGRGPRKELNVVMDNCGGQNKNRYVLRLAPLFVELRYYRRVNIIFLVAGHTKNAADRLFNLLKVQYRKKQVFTMEQLESLLNENQYVECEKVGEDNFYDVGKFEDKIYKQNPLSGHTKKYQLFFADECDMGILFARPSNKEGETTHRMDLKKGRESQRKELLKPDMFGKFDLDKKMELLKPPGIRTIKQVELYTKWRKHVPDELKSPLYDNPGEDVLLAVKEDRKSKKEYIASRRQQEEAIDKSGILASRKTTMAVQTQTRTKTKRLRKTTAATTAPSTRNTTTEVTAKQKKPPAKRKK